MELIVDRQIVKSGLSVRGESEVTWLDCPQVGLWQCDVINLAGGGGSSPGGRNSRDGLLDPSSMC